MNCIEGYRADFTSGCSTSLLTVVIENHLRFITGRRTACKRLVNDYELHVD